MQELNYRTGQGVSLTYQQTDDNFKRVKAAIDALETAVASVTAGTVTSVGLSLPNIFSVSNSPVTGSGTLTATFASQSSNLIFASPNGTSGTPVFRSIVTGDLPTIPYTKGGTGLTTAALNTLLVGNGAGYTSKTISSSSAGLTITQNPTDITLALNLASISLTSLGGVLSSSQGGTGVTTASNGQLLIGNGTGFSLATLTQGTGITITNASGAITISASGAGVASLNGLTGVLTATTGTSGTDFNISTPSATEIRFNFPNASATNRGLLTSTDWNAFNSKFTLPSLTSGSILFSNGSTIAQDNANLFWDDANNRLGLGTSTPSQRFHSFSASAPIVHLLEGLTGTSYRVTGGATGNFSALNGNVGVSSSALLNFCPNGLSLSLGQFAARFEANNIFSVKYGIAIDNIAYYNSTGGSSTSIAGDSYGVILGAATAATITVTLPTTPIDGQEVIILVEEDKTLTVSTGTARLIYGKASVPASSVTLTININTHGTALIFKYYSAGNSGAGAWYLTGF